MKLNYMHTSLRLSVELVLLLVHAADLGLQVDDGGPRSVLFSVPQRGRTTGESLVGESRTTLTPPSPL